MAKTVATHRLVISGETRPHRDVLKAAGWKWNPDAQHWYMMLVDAHAQRIVDGDQDFVAGLKAKRKGCQVTLDGVVRWTSKVFGQPASGSGSASRHIAAGDIYQHDAHGNYVPGQRIPGSAPDDMI